MTDTIVMKVSWNSGSKMVWYVTKSGICHRGSMKSIRTKNDVKDFYNYKIKMLMGSSDYGSFYFNPVAFKRIKS